MVNFDEVLLQEVLDDLVWLVGVDVFFDSGGVLEVLVVGSFLGYVILVLCEFLVVVEVGSVV